MAWKLAGYRQETSLENVFLLVDAGWLNHDDAPCWHDVARLLLVCSPNENLIVVALASN